MVVCASWYVRIDTGPTGVMTGRVYYKSLEFTEWRIIIHHCDESTTQVATNWRIYHIYLPTFTQITYIRRPRLSTSFAIFQRMK